MSEDELLAETLTRLQRANNGLRLIEAGELPEPGGKLTGVVARIRSEVAQSAMTIEILMERRR